MKVVISVILSLFTVASIAAPPLQNPITVQLNKDDKKQWTVTFKSEKPMQKLVFHKSPNFSRSARWKPEHANFAIKKFIDKDNSKEEYVVRTDGGKFTSVKFTLTTSYTHLPKEYAPFSPFSDGGMLIHTRRFFACAESCPEDLDYWQFNVSTPKTDAIIVNGQRYAENVTWVESGWGSKFYVGSTLPFEDEHFIFVIDQKLPAAFKQKLDESLPKLTQRLSELMARPKHKPMFFASYSEPKDRNGRQGGTLPNQIFVQWFGTSSKANMDSLKELWFITHEMAHFYQKDIFASQKPEAQWVHEGHAEIMTGLLTAELFEMQPYFDKQLREAKAACLNAFEKETLQNGSLQNESSFAELSKQDYKLAYHCGLVIWGHIANDLRKNIEKDLKQHNPKISDVFTLWEQLATENKQDLPLDLSGFITALAPHLSPSLAQDIKALITDDTFDMQAFVNRLD